MHAYRPLRRAGSRLGPTYANSLHAILELCQLAFHIDLRGSLPFLGLVLHLGIHQFLLPPLIHSRGLHRLVVKQMA